MSFITTTAININLKKNRVAKFSVTIKKEFGTYSVKR